MGTTPIRSVWSDKFREPTRDALLAGLADRQHAALAAQTREQLTALANVRESLAWLGTPWRWTLLYNCDMDPTRALAYLVPDPARLQVCVPLTTVMIQSMPLRRLKKNVREGIMYSKVVAGTYWPTWDLSSRAALEDVLDLVSRKHKYVHAGQEQMVAMSS